MIPLPVPPPKLQLACLPTPLRKLERLSAELNGTSIWLKCDDLTGSLLSGNKVRKLEYLLADALDKGADTIITCGGIQSNHCRATALACAQLGLRCVLILREGDYPRPDGLEMSRHEGNLLLDALAKAELHIHPREEFMRKRLSLFRMMEERLQSEGARPYSIPTGGSNGLGVWGYLNGGLELQADCRNAGFVPDAVVCASGSGGTQAGLTLANTFAPAGEKTRVIGMAVCDSTDWFNRKVNLDVESWCQLSNLDEDSHRALLGKLTPHTIDRYIGPGYAKPYPEILVLIHRLAALEGVVLDPVYTGKAFHGMLKEIRDGELRDMRNIVFMHTGGLFGMFPYAQLLLGSTDKTVSN